MIRTLIFAAVGERTRLTQRHVLALALAAAAMVAAPNPAQSQTGDPPASAPAKTQTTPAPTPAQPTSLANEPGDDTRAPITGSRIAGSDATGSDAVLVLDRATLEAAGVTSLGDILQQDLTAHRNGINTQFNNGGSGAIRLSLRGFGASRTLVLVNGRRYAPGGNGANSSVDLSTLPLAIVDRVEVLSGAGGAPIYGANAAAGVVNVITRELRGTEARLQTETTDASAGPNYHASVATGLSTGRGQVTVAGEYYGQRAIMADERGFSRFERAYDWARNDGSDSLTGSLATPEGTLVDVEGTAGNAQWQDVVTGPCRTFICVRDPALGTWRDFRLGGLSDLDQGDLYNYQPETYLVTPNERLHLFASGRYRFTPALQGFFEASYSRRSSEQRFAPEQLFTTAEGLVVSANNLYNPFGRDFSWMARRMTEGGNRLSSQQVDAVRAIAGVTGEQALLDSPWRWTLAVNYSRIESTETSKGRYRTDRLADALGPSFIDAAGIARCGTPGNQIAGCVPLTLFDGLGSITPEMLAYIDYTGRQEGLNEHTELDFHVGGRLVKFPTGGGLDIAAGASCTPRVSIRLGSRAI